MPAAGQDAPAAESSETPEDSPSADVAAPIDTPEAPAPEEPIAAAPVEPEAPEPEPVVAAPIATQPPPVAPAAPIATPAPVAPVAPVAPAAPAAPVAGLETIWNQQRVSGASCDKLYGHLEPLGSPNLTTFYETANND